jgi:hypothetical protein
LELNRNDQIKPGDIIVLPFNNTNVHPLRDSLTVVAEIIHAEPCAFLSIMNKNAHAGFYSHGWGPLPYAFGPAQKELYSVNKVR